MVSASVDGGNELAILLDENVDDRLIGGTGVGLGKLTAFVASLVRSAQTGLVRMYALGMLFGVVGITIFVLILIHGGQR